MPKGLVYCVQQKRGSKYWLKRGGLHQVRKFRGKIVSVFVNFEKLTSSHNGQVDLGPTKLLERVEIGCQCKLHVYDTR